MEGIAREIRVVTKAKEIWKKLEVIEVEVLPSDHRFSRIFTLSSHRKTSTGQLQPGIPEIKKGKTA